MSVREDKVVHITVAEGTNKPYYLKGKGLKPSGVYVRQGTSSVPASPELIRRMIKDSDGDTFEDERSLDQELTFQSAKTSFERYGVEFGEEKYRALGITHNGIFTNLGLILSDQCPYTLKTAVFSDEEQKIFAELFLNHCLAVQKSLFASSALLSDDSLRHLPDAGIVTFTTVPPPSRGLTVSVPPHIISSRLRILFSAM